MVTIYNPDLKAAVILDNDGEVRGLNYLDEYPEIENRNGLEAAIAYVRTIAGNFNVVPDQLQRIEQRVSYFNPQPQDVEFRFNQEKYLFDSAIYGFYQTYLNTPVWASGITATLKQAPWRVVSATNTSARNINAEMPSNEAIERYRQLFATGEKVDDPRLPAIARRQEESNIADSNLLSEILSEIGNEETGIDNPSQTPPRLIRGRFFVYRYESAKRTHDWPHPNPNPQIPPTHVPAQSPEQPVCGTPPTLPLPPVPREIQEGQWYVVAELVFRLPYEGSRMNWRMLVDVETNGILYLRALSSGVNGLVFTYDPITSTGTATNTPDQSNAVLNPHRDDVALLNLNPPVGGVQSLTGAFANVTDVSAPSVSSPTEPVGSDFDYDVRTNDFAAVNAYYHVDRFFRLVTDLGFSIATYFDGTSFPIEVDHRGLGNNINANCVGDGDGIDYTNYALADNADTTNPIGIAADWRVVLHELGGHGILYDHVNSANFGFAHSAGDSFAMILNDFASEWHNGAAIDRFLLAPFVPAVARRSDRTVASGWGWGGTNDVGGYFSEQILSTTLFRAYRSIGGDSTSLNRREFAARCMAYLMLRAVATLTPTSNPSLPEEFLSALLSADALNWTSEGVFGGAYGKVLTWAFEKQNLNGGAPPNVDVYIDDGRGGEYEYLPVHWATTAIWNRRNPDGITGHQEPALGETNYGYVRIKNRGTSVANNVIVKAYHCKPSAGVLWPNDLQPMTTTQISAGTLQPNNAEEKIVGPFEWTPAVNAWGHDCMLTIVSADGDPSNVDNFMVGEVAEDWRLVPNDNNVAQRNVTLVPGGGGVRGLIAGLQDKGFWIRNPGRATALVTASIELPPLLLARGWRVTLRHLPEGGLRLKGGEERLVTFEVRAGSPFTKEDVIASTERKVTVMAMADGAIVGGMVYQIDPNLELPYNDRKPQDKKDKCRDKAEELLECLNVPDGNVKRVHVRKIAIDVEMADDCCCD
jgi:hypothetical protein